MLPFKVSSIARILVAVLAFCLAPSSFADIYKYVDKHGRVTLTDTPNHVGYKRLIKTWKGWEEAKSQIALRDFEKNRKLHTSTIDDYARRSGLPPSLVHAVVTVESAYDPNAISRAGAVGLMQLMPETAKRFGVYNRRSPSENLQAGTQYLRELLLMFDNNLLLALAAYNAGENAVKKYGNKIPPYEETKKYVNKVIGFYKRYKNTAS